MDSINFPWRRHSESELQNEYTRLKNKLSKQNPIFPFPFSTIGFKCTNYFFQYERMNTSGIGRPTTIEYWNKNKDNVIKFSNKEKRDYFSTLNYFNHTPSQFPIMTAGRLYKHFGATKIFDPYAGWGDRCLAAMALGIDYTGVDSNPNLETPFNNLLKKYDTQSNIKMIFDKCENVNISDIDFDFVFSSPPFWNKGKMIERYNNIELDYKTFMETSLIPVINTCLKKNACICLYIPEDMYRDLSLVVGACSEVLEFKITRKKIGIIYCWR